MLTNSSTTLTIYQGRQTEMSGLSRLENPYVFLAHGSDLMLAGLSTVLPRETNVCGKYSSLEALMKQLSKTSEGLLILDDQLDVSPLEMIREVRATAPQIRTILLSRWITAIYIDQVFHAGAHSFLCTAEPLGDLLPNALQVAANGRRYLSPEASSHYVMYMMESQLSGREFPESEAWEALVLLMNGRDVHQTAAKMAVNIDKVYRLHKRLRDWFSVSTNAELVRQAALFGFGIQK